MTSIAAELIAEARRVIEDMAADHLTGTLTERLADALEAQVAASATLNREWLAKWNEAREYADTLEPLVVSTVAELDALPRQSVIISKTGTGPYRKTEEGWVSHFSGPYSAELMVEPALVSQPLVVLWVGGTE